MIVEFFGASGAGKTYLLRRLVTAKDTEVRLMSRRVVARGVLLFVVRHPISFCVLSIELVANNQRLKRYKAGLLFRSMAARAYAERSDPQHIAYIDEGLLQRIVTIFDTPLSKRHAAFLLRMTPLPDVAIVMRGGTFGRFTTADNRTNSPRVQQGEEAFTAWTESVHANVGIIASLLPTRTRVIVCTREQSDAEPHAVRSKLEQYRNML